MNQIDLVRKCADLSGRIYSSLGFSEDGCKFGEVYNPKLIHDRKTDTTCVVCEDDDYVYVIFEGTDSVTDIRTDLRFRQKQTDTDLNIHRGFYEAWVGVAVDLTTEIWVRDIDHQEAGIKKKLVFTGHSLGGAIANIAAAGHAYETHHLITFGQPEVGGPVFAKEVENQGIKFVRVVNHRDPVPHLLRWNINYRHGGSVLYLDNDYNGHKNPSDWFMWKDRAWRMWDVSDHSIEEYEDKLNAIGSL